MQGLEWYSVLKRTSQTPQDLSAQNKCTYTLQVTWFTLLSVFPIDQNLSSRILCATGQVPTNKTQKIQGLATLDRILILLLSLNVQIFNKK